MRSQDILSALQYAYKGIYGSPNLAPDSVIGQRINLEVQILALAWEGLELAYNAAFPSLCDEGSIDNVMMLAGLTRLPATPTVITCDCVFTQAATIPAGSLVANSAGSIFAAVADIIALAPGSVTGNFACIETGPVPCPSPTLTIQTPVTGWECVAVGSYYGDTSAYVEVGSNLETLAEARARRMSSLLIPGSGTLESIRSAVLNNVSSVNECLAVENDTNSTDTNGLPPHSIEIICQSADTGPAEQAAIAAQIWAKRAAGITMHGTTSVTVTDSRGRAHTVKFSYSTRTEVNVAVTYSLFPEDPTPPPLSVSTALAVAITAAFDAQAIGEDVLFNRILGAAASVPGIRINTLTLDGGTSDITITEFSRGVVGIISITEA
jgi:hypothetical protein